jgi:lipopolysaccharide transport system permease protein
MDTPCSPPGLAAEPPFLARGLAAATEVHPLAAEPPLIVIERRPGWHLVNFGELWRYRELLYFLAWRDIKLRYKQTVLGAAWVVLQPLATMVVFSFFLGRLPDLTAPLAYPYSLFVFAGLLPWTFLSSAVTSSGQSVVANQNLVTKVYFPRLLIPLAAVGAHLVDFVIAFAMLLVLMAWHHVPAGMGLVAVPLLTLGLIVAALGMGTFLSALTVAYRDFRHVVPFLVQLWMFATPSIYMQAERVVGARGQLLLPLNPAYGLIVNFRQAMLGGPPNWYALVVSSGVSVLLLAAGCTYFRRVESRFADII